MRILIIEDDCRLSNLLKRNFDEFNYDVTIAADGDAGLRLAQSAPYDIIILDIILPKLNGVQLCKAIRKSLLEIPIIILTSLGTTDNKLEGFDAGADDYLVKPFDFRELHIRILVLTKKRKYNKHAEVVSYGGLVVNLQKMTVLREGLEINLTVKEFKLLHYLLLNAERVVSKEEIAENVWGINFDRGTNFINVYINYLRSKIDKGFNDKLIHTKNGVGFLLKKRANMSEPSIQ